MSSSPVEIPSNSPRLAPLATTDRRSTLLSLQELDDRNGAADRTEVDRVALQQEPGQHLLGEEHARRLSQTSTQVGSIQHSPEEGRESRTSTIPPTVQVFSDYPHVTTNQRITAHRMHLENAPRRLISEQTGIPMDILTATNTGDRLNQQQRLNRLIQSLSVLETRPETTTQKPH